MEFLSQHQLEINACGLVGSKRGKNDGCVILGTSGLNEHEEGPPLNDFTIGFDENGPQRHTIIKYNLADRRYYMRDLGDGQGTFVRIERQMLLKNGYILSFGDSHLTVNFWQELSKGTMGDTWSKNRIQLKFIDGPKTDLAFDFGPEEHVLIGRMPTCQIKFDDNQLSRLQCSIYHDSSVGGWIVCDGDGDKMSTNGTWLFVDELHEITDNMVFKTGQILFQAQLVPQHT